MEYFKIFIIFITTTLLYGQNAGVNAGFAAQIPKGEFASQGVSTGLGIDINGLYYPVKELGFGLNLGYSVYGYSERDIQFNYFTDLVKVREKTTNELGYGHIFFRILPFHGNIKPYIEGLIGLKNLSTKTEVININCPDDEDTDDCQIAESTNATDNAFSYGFGGGLEIKLTTLTDENDNPSGDLSFFINTRYLMGAKAKYLKKGSITFSDPEDGPVKTSFNWSESKTDVLQIVVGINISFHDF